MLVSKILCPGRQGCVFLGNVSRNQGVAATLIGSPISRTDQYKSGYCCFQVLNYKQGSQSCRRYDSKFNIPRNGCNEKGNLAVIERGAAGLVSRVEALVDSGRQKQWYDSSQQGERKGPRSESG